MRYFLTAALAGFLGLGIIGLEGQVVAEDAAVTVGTPNGLALEPAGFTMTGRRARQQLLVTAKYSAGELRDLTTVAKLVSSNPKVVTVTDGIARPVADGTAKLTAEIGALKSTIDVTVKNFAAPHPFSFKNEMLAALSKGGCNAGACHGSPSGKAGFRLSLRAFDPPLDIMTLRHEFFGRRTNAMAPSKSLIVRKAQPPHLF